MHVFIHPIIMTRIYGKKKEKKSKPNNKIADEIWIM